MASEYIGVSGASVRSIVHALSGRPSRASGRSSHTTNALRSARVMAAKRRLRTVSKNGIAYSSRLSR
jgi:hypothetical protein